MLIGRLIGRKPMKEAKEAKACGDGSDGGIPSAAKPWGRPSVLWEGWGHCSGARKPSAHERLMAGPWGGGSVLWPWSPRSRSCCFCVGGRRVKVAPPKKRTKKRTKKCSENNEGIRVTSLGKISHRFTRATDCLV